MAGYGRFQVAASGSRFPPTSERIARFASQHGARERAGKRTVHSATMVLFEYLPEALVICRRGARLLADPRMREK